MEAGRIVGGNIILKIKTQVKREQNNLLLIYFKQEVKEALYLKK